MQVAPSLRAKWFWYSILTVILWGGWAILEKVGSREISPKSVQFLFAFGGLPVALALIFAQRLKVERKPIGVFYAVAIGILAGVGNAALAAAYRAGGSTSVITVATAMYPMLTVILARFVLRERLTRVHMIGLGFAAVAFAIFSI